MVRSVLHLHVRPGRGRDFEVAFRGQQVFARAAAAARMRTGELLRPLDGSTYLVVATWDRPEDYRAWLDSPVRAEVNAVLTRFTSPAGAAELFEIADAHGE